MDIEGYAKRGLSRHDPDLEQKLTDRILEIKDISRKRARDIASATIVEAHATLRPAGEILTPITSGVTMGEFGVGSRGAGDFYAHEKIAEVIGKTDAIVDSSHLDDSGVVRITGQDGQDRYVVLNIDGIHSRLSDFPFLAGFHVARAALRDIYVMGALPVAMLSDIHIADDGDVGKIFDHIAGISAVAELTHVPLVTGSTLRIGGDMVIGDRMTGGVGAVGVARDLTARIDTAPGDAILMTEGAGGGTISTAALYYGMHDVVDETINITFIEACDALFAADLPGRIHAMTDVTNGGVRGDAKEISRTARVKLVFYEEKMRNLVNPKVLSMLESLEIDYLGVSLDALLLIAPPDAAPDIMDAIRGAGVRIDVVGEVCEGEGAELVIDGEVRDFTPRFRESAYTPIKKLVGEAAPEDYELMCAAVDRAAVEAGGKRDRVVARVRGA
ncbi:MAG: Selenide, water dikinase [Candidatus Methanogasteraceae archaeon]|nr:MAG: Selenide, water dikinase [ANME-2 cluster archaeon]